MIYGALLAAWSARASEMRDLCADASEAAYRELTATVGDLVVEFDRGGSVLELVTDPANAFRRPRRDFMGRGLFDRIQVADRPAFLNTLADAASNDEVAEIEFRLRAGAEATTKRIFPPFRASSGWRCGRTARARRRMSSWRSCAT